MNVANVWNNHGVCKWTWRTAIDPKTCQGFPLVQRVNPVSHHKSTIMVSINLTVMMAISPISAPTVIQMTMAQNYQPPKITGAMCGADNRGIAI